MRRVNKKKHMKNVIIKSLVALNLLIAFASVSALDSACWIPALIVLALSVAFLILVGIANSI